MAAADLSIIALTKFHSPTKVVGYDFKIDVEVIGIIRLQYAKAVFDRQSRRADQKPSCECFAGLPPHGVDRLPSNQHGHDGSLSGPPSRALMQDASIQGWRPCLPQRDAKAHAVRCESAARLRLARSPRAQATVLLSKINCSATSRKDCRRYAPAIAVIGGESCRTARRDCAARPF
jgi:hypothetical protein